MGLAEACPLSIGLIVNRFGRGTVREPITIGGMETGERKDGHTTACIRFAKDEVQITTGYQVFSSRHPACSDAALAPKRRGNVSPNFERHQRYENRQHAGVVLAGRLQHFKGRTDVVVLALPRGGVPVAHEVARALDVPLDVFLVRKLGVPGQRELAMGAIASGGVRVLNEDIVAAYRVPKAAIDRVAREEQVELERREHTYRNGRAAVELRDRIVLLIDDGLATGATMKAAVEAVRAHDPARIVVAVPVGSPETCREFADVADEIVCARAPEYFAAVGQWYRDFSQTSDEEVRELLQEHSELVTRVR